MPEIVFRYLLTLTVDTATRLLSAFGSCQYVTLHQATYDYTVDVSTTKRVNHHAAV